MSKIPKGTLYTFATIKRWHVAEATDEFRPIRIRVRVICTEQHRKRPARPPVKSASPQKPSWYPPVPYPCQYRKWTLVLQGYWRSLVCVCNIDMKLMDVLWPTNFANDKSVFHEPVNCDLIVSVEHANNFLFHLAGHSHIVELNVKSERFLGEFRIASID